MYEIWRYYQNSNIPAERVEKYDSLDEAQAHCHDPETQSSSATSPEAVERTQKHGAWFEGYTGSD